MRENDQGAPSDAPPAPPAATAITGFGLQHIDAEASDIEEVTEPAPTCPICEPSPASPVVWPQH